MPEHDPDRTAVVTGSSSGIGLATAVELAREGWRVVLNSRDAGRARDAANEVLAHVPRATAVGLGADVSDPDQAAGLVDAAHELMGRVDLLVNNAGQPHVAPSAQLSVHDWRRMLDTDLSGPFWCAQAAARHMIADGSGGVIVNVSSIFGHVGNTQRAAYVASKHGLLGLTKALAVEWAPHSIRVVSVDPAYIATPLVVAAQAAGGFDDDDLRRRTPMARIGTPDEVARAIAWISSPAASYVTGSSLVVDGGWLAHGGL